MIAPPEVESLLARMTLAEKIGQMAQYHCYDRDGALAAARSGNVGSFLNAPDLATRNELQRAALEGSRLGIPLLFGRDVIHGFRTVFPIPLGQAASFHPELVEAAAAVAAREAAAEGIDWTFAPMVDVTREPRWGRVAESPGEDPWLASAMGAAMVRGFQGDDPSAPDRVAACAKHYVGYGAVEAGKDYNTTYIPEALLRELYLPPFRACVAAGALTVMTGFHDLNGTPATANEATVRGILKGEWGFSGLVVSDWASMMELIEHGVCEDAAAVARASLAAGVDLEMVTRAYLEELPALVATGQVQEALVDDAVRRILTVKHQLGLFQRPYAAEPAPALALAPDALELARKLAQQSLVLLRNERATLPLSDTLASIAVVGPLADAARDQLGCWAYDGVPERAITVLAALRERCGERVQLHYAAGLADARDTSHDGFAAAVAAAEAADVTIAVLGESAILSGEAHCRAFLELPGAQRALLERLAATGKPVVLVVYSGRPLEIGNLLPHTSALLWAWHPGTLGGPAIADVLFGDESPSGRLPITFPRAVGQIPIYHAAKNTGRPPKSGYRGIPPGTPLDPVGFETSYLDLDVTPEFPFGFGLSYTTFRYSELTVHPPRAPLEQGVAVRCVVENGGTRAADEVVQVYIRDLVASVTRPVRELRAFRRVRLDPGERRTITIELPPQAFALVGRDLRAVVEPGRFRIFVGGDSTAELSLELELV